MKASIAYFENTDSINGVMSALEQAGIARDDVTILGSAKANEIANIVETEPEESAVKGAAVGGSVGTTLGLIGAAAVSTIPGIGPVIAAGAMTTLTGGFVGSYLGAIYGTRADTQDELTFEDAVGQGGVLVIVENPSDAIVSVLKTHGGQNADVYEVNTAAVEKAS